MKKIKHKAIQLKSWVSGKVRGDNGEISYGKTCVFLATGYTVIGPFVKFLLNMIVLILKGLYIIIPYAIHFVEGLISTLSYSLNKKEFFYEL